jgi:carbohydrate-binding DOMON domain-containing protein
VPLREAVPSAVVGAVVPSLLDLSIKTIVQHSQVRVFCFWVW